MSAEVSDGLPVSAAAHEARIGGWGLRRCVVLIVHLVRRDVAASSRFSVIGAGWPLLRQLAQLAVLVVAFSVVLDLDIPNYPAFIFCGLIGWTWFVSAMGGSASAVRGHQELAMRPGFPSVVLPVVAVALPAVDVLFALPVLLALLVATGSLAATAPLLLLLLLLQGLLMVGAGWILGALGVLFRDVPNIVGLAVLMGFYLTPVYFDVGRVPDRYQWVLRLNPMATLLEADRAVLLGTPYPPLWALGSVVLLAAALAVAGFHLFRRLAPSFSDEL